MDTTKLKEWAEKVSKTKKELDKDIFDDLIKQTLTRLENKGYEETMKGLKEHYLGGMNHRMVGPKLLSKSSKQVKDKLWSLNRGK